ncbi:HlyD family efflux transporter periplasmic adaptor subunit [Colwellia sp. M166]|uniref:HlyD family secretion protein n=1 Tax=Colwellia sp. M166 TaxID=2583805 RepID=UPI00211F3D53|nr:HlyD family efflux transporter periplasmic adaptor subunit [Colwellia sp. M166]UUO24164.1 HlyD family efflux transporter periplasmic adaptor subunit [Colwellia sp. M166]|tara:strand:- start:10115 stop:11083 length:969 start_codon:yes stop_codon:yes gene_type:complete
MLNKILISFILLLFVGCSHEQENVALGTLERDRIAHTATVSEVITDLPIAAGSKVTKGMVLVKLDDDLQKASVAKARAQVQQAQATLTKAHNGARAEEVAAAKANVAGAKAALAKSMANYTRAKSLIKANLTSQAALDDAIASRDENLATLSSTQEQLLQLINGTRIEDLAIAEAVLASNIAMLSSEEKKLSNLTITAKRDGILDNLPWNLGERVTAGSPVAIVLAGKAPFARVYIPGPYRVHIKVGDPLAVHVDGLAKPILGKVRWIATEPAFTPYYALNQAERANLMYLAEIMLPDNTSDLPSGIPAQVVLPLVTGLSER